MTARNPPNLWSFAHKFAEAGEDSEKNRRDGNSPAVAHQEGGPESAERLSDVDTAHVGATSMEFAKVAYKWTSVERRKIEVWVYRKAGGAVDVEAVLDTFFKSILSSPPQLPNDAEHRNKLLWVILKRALYATLKGNRTQGRAMERLETDPTRRRSQPPTGETSVEAKRLRAVLDAWTGESEERQTAVRAWLLHRVDGLTQPEVAEMEEVHASTIKRRISDVEEWLNRTIRRGGGRP